MMDLLRDEAAEDVKLAFPADESKRLLGLPCASPWGISRARHGDDTNPLYRVRCWILALRKIGAPRERAQRIIDRLQDLVDMLWPTDDDEDPTKLSEREQEVDGPEDGLQLAYALGRPGSRRAWINQLVDRRAVERQLIRALEAEERREELERRTAA
jgi:hypothetical protein